MISPPNIKEKHSNRNRAELKKKKRKSMSKWGMIISVSLKRNMFVLLLQTLAQTHQSFCEEKILQLRTMLLKVTLVVKQFLVGKDAPACVSPKLATVQRKWRTQLVWATRPASIANSGSAAAPESNQNKQKANQQGPLYACKPCAVS